MTVPQERDDDRFVLDILGFGAPAALEPVAPPAEPAHPSSPSRELAPVPLTRREVRERERETDEPPARRGTGTPGATSTPRTRSRSAPRRMSRNSTRRDAVRAAGTKKTLGKRLMSFGAMVFIGALAFGLTVPANAFNATTDQQLADSLAMGSQSVAVDPTLVTFAERDAWTVTSWAEMLRLRYGTRDFGYTVGNGGAIRWPFPYAVPITSGFGAREAPCRGCSTTHSGIDMGGGNGSAIFAVADGVVYERGDGGTTWGTYAIIKHEINGQTVYSGYAHMQAGSSPLVVGQPVKVGDFVGLVGSTGRSSGPHLHFTISIGEPQSFIDPFTWLKENAG